MLKLILTFLIFSGFSSRAAIDSTQQGFQLLQARVKPRAASLTFDIPVTYNREVKKWIDFFRTSGRPTFKRWLERSSRYFPLIQSELELNGLPRDLAYVVMIESGFTAHAMSHADAVGPWQFIQSTANRYGLKTYWWLDERRDLRKSTQAAIRYMRDLYREFESWYLVAASYNMGENGLRRNINKQKTHDYWKLCERKALPQETCDYIPKLLATVLIAKAPSLYGFRDLSSLEPTDQDFITVPGGTYLDEVADYIGVTRRALRELNAELPFAWIPSEVASHKIRVPKGAKTFVEKYLASKDPSSITKKL